MQVSSTPTASLPLSPGKSNLVPPGLAKRDFNLPPGIAKKLAVGGTVPPGIAKRFPAETANTTDPQTDGVTPVTDTSSQESTTSVDILV